jgi:hypothetical protein
MHIDFAADSAKLSQMIGAVVTVRDDATVLAGVTYPAIGVGVVRGNARDAKLFEGNSYSIETAAEWAKGH